MRRHGILVGLDGVRSTEDGLGGVLGGVAIHGFEEREQRRIVGIDGGYDGQVILILEEVLGSGGDRVVERVDKGGVVRAEGELVDLVREVESCKASAMIHPYSVHVVGQIPTAA